MVLPAVKIDAVEANPICFQVWCSEQAHSPLEEEVLSDEPKPPALRGVEVFPLVIGVVLPFSTHVFKSERQEIDAFPPELHHQPAVGRAVALRAQVQPDCSRLP